MLKFALITVLIVTVIIIIAIAHKPQPTPNDVFQIVEIAHFLSKEECEYLIKIAKEKGMEKSMVYTDNGDMVDSSVRISEQTWLYDTDNEFVKQISQRIAKFVNMPVENQEAMQLLHYHPGGMYNPHHDACEGDEDSCFRMNKNGGPRLLTVIVYLNDDFEGGGTDFPNVGITVQPVQGKAVIFNNVDMYTHEILQDSLHAGLPVTNGEKWMLNKWIHTKKYTV